MKTLILCLAVVGIAMGFQCPEPHGFFAHPVECDGYYECKNNVPSKKVCEDGLLFDTSNPNLEKCDLPFSVDCGDRTELQPAQSTIQCPRKNGFFSHEDPSVCDRFYNCVNGLANVQHCSSGLIYDDYTGTCTWPADVQRPECSKDKIKKEVLADGFSCPNDEVIGPNGRPLPHPTYPHPEDCQKFYICQLGSRPQLGSCPSGTVYSETSFRCEDPENVPGCEKWFDEA